jgi:hypothetical protein
MPIHRITGIERCPLHMEFLKGTESRHELIIPSYFNISKYRKIPPLSIISQATP